MNVLDIKGLNIIYLGVSSRFFYKLVFEPCCCNCCC